MKPADAGRLRGLLLRQRWAALATVDDGQPCASMVAYVFTDDGSLLLHLSRMARHARNLLANPTASLVISEHDDGDVDPQTLARLTIEGKSVVLERGSEAYLAAKQTYLDRLPDAEMLFGFEDFSLFKLNIASAHYVEGFGSTHRYTRERLLEFIKE